MRLGGTGLRRVAALVAAGALAAGIVWVAPRVWRRPAAPPAAAPDAGDGKIALSEQARRDAGIEVVGAVSLARRSRITAPGVLSLDETRTARIGSMVEGRVDRLIAQVGDRVSGGQVLAELHAPLIHQFWAEYRKALAERKRAQTELDYATQAHLRAQRLYADKAVSLQEVQRAAADRAGAEQLLEMAKTDVRRSEENLEHLGITSGEDPTGEVGEFIPVRTPITGAVLARHVTQDTAVTPGMLLFVVSDLSTLWALAEIDETALPRVRVGQPVEVSVAAYPDEVFPGTIIFVADTLDPKTRRASVRCRVPNADGRLKPEMYATIALGEEAARTITAVPVEAIQEFGGKTVVFVEQDGGFVMREVVVGQEDGGLVEISSGLRPEERVAAAGSFLLKSQLLKGAVAAEE
jgi:cobalt-zinc-cadmium efflux system membrane fusion protein